MADVLKASPKENQHAYYILKALFKNKDRQEVRE
jgi:hypothetical protein